MRKNEIKETLLALGVTTVVLAGATHLYAHHDSQFSYEHATINTVVESIETNPAKGDFTIHTANGSLNLDMKNEAATRKFESLKPNDSLEINYRMEFKNGELLRQGVHDIVLNGDEYVVNGGTRSNRILDEAHDKDFADAVGSELNRSDIPYDADFENALQELQQHSNTLEQ